LLERVLLWEGGEVDPLPLHLRSGSTVAADGSEISAVPLPKVVVTVEEMVSWFCAAEDVLS
jgi:nitrous oxide reductase accessory protein NosL